MRSFIKFKDLIDRELQQIDYPDHPSNLYNPIKYILGLEAKRIRSIALLLAHNFFDDNLSF